MFKNKVVFISGATGKVGKDLCSAFANLGANLIITDLEKKKLDKLQKKIMERYKIKIFSMAADLSNIKSRDKLIKVIKKKYRNVNFIINNAGYTGSLRNKKDWIGNINEQKLNIWNRALEVNLTSIFHICKELHKLQKKNEDYAIINIGSIYSDKGPDLNIYKSTKMGSPAAYLSSKGGLLQLTRWLASNLAPIRVNMVSPGGIYNKQPKSFVKKYLKKILIKRMCETKDISNLILFLCSKNSCYITGQNIKVDGGYSCI